MDINKYFDGMKWTQYQELNSFTKHLLKQKHKKVEQSLNNINVDLTFEDFVFFDQYLIKQKYFLILIRKYKYNFEDLENLPYILILINEMKNTNLHFGETPTSQFLHYFNKHLDWKYLLHVNNYNENFINIFNEYFDEYNWCCISMRKKLLNYECDNFSTSFLIKWKSQIFWEQVINTGNYLSELTVLNCLDNLKILLKTNSKILQSSNIFQYYIMKHLLDEIQANFYRNFSQYKITFWYYSSFHIKDFKTLETFKNEIYKLTG